VKRRVLLLALPAALVVACRAPGERAERESDVLGPGIVAAGQAYDVGVEVVRWFEAPRYSAYSAGRCYRAGREAVGGGPADVSGLEALARQVELLVVHYDACGTSRRCQRVLGERGLSAHFLLDVDGTLYQTLDLADQAWHARHANPRSIGVEVANVGARTADEAALFEDWYERDGSGARLRLPAEERVALRTAGFVGRPARPEPVRAELRGRSLVQYDFTDEQYASLAALAAGLARVLPGIALDAPRDASGAIESGVLSEERLASFRGIVGHLHVSVDKIDPGPAFDWERFLREARRSKALAEIEPRGAP